MTDYPTLTPDEQLVEDAKAATATPPEPVPDAQGLPADVPDGNPDADDGSDIHTED